MKSMECTEESMDDREIGKVKIPGLKLNLEPRHHLLRMEWETFFRKLTQPVRKIEIQLQHSLYLSFSDPMRLKESLKHSIAGWNHPLHLLPCTGR